MVPSAVVGAPMTATKTAPAADADDPSAPLPPRPDAGEPDFAPVIRSKIQPPPLRSTTLTRQRLIDRLHGATQSRVTLLIAEAGYGKTTLLADFASRSGQRTLWYRLDPTDADAITWTNYLIAACREVDPSFGKATLRLLSHARAGMPPRAEFLEAFAAELASWTAAPTTLVLDDFHRVDRSSEACEVVYRLLETAPQWFHIVISTRRRPPLELARLAVAGDLAELGSDELRFSESETSRLFADCYGRPIDQDVVRSIDQRTRGWAASLALVYGSIRDKSSQATIALADELSGASKPIYDFLAEEVLKAVPLDVESVLMRASIVDGITVEVVSALLSREPMPPTASAVQALLDEAEGIGMLSRVSRSSDRREMHPLLRDFLATRLKDRLGPDAIRQLHADVANAISATDPLVACQHFILAGDYATAMIALESSILETLGSGRWGLAANLIEALRDVPAGPGVAAIRARQLMEDGDLAGAERILESVDVESASPPLRSALRQTLIALGWRTGNRETVRSAVEALLSDRETPGSVREIAEIMSNADDPPALHVLASRLAHMAQTQARDGLEFYSAVALHNASVAYLAAADYDACLRTAREALGQFSRLPYRAAEAFSTHSVAAVALLELGRDIEADEHVLKSMEGGREFADVPALIAVAYLSIGQRSAAATLISRAQALERQGRTDVPGVEMTEMAYAYSLLASEPSTAVDLLSVSTGPSWLDLGQAVERKSMLAHACLSNGREQKCLEVALTSLDEARQRGVRRVELRLAVLAALASASKQDVATAIREAATGSHLALSELADVLCDRLDLADQTTDELGAAIRAHPGRWLPALRQTLGRGAPAGHRAALLIDRFGESKDVGVLRAYARTYRNRGASPALGITLARRTSPRLQIHDLGKVILEVGQRSVALSGMRRKPAALLMYLVSRPAFTAHREQVMNELWPDADPSSALNSLNQSLYFLRREIDPWYEDGVTPDYIGFEGDLIWLDSELVASDSSAFLSSCAGYESREVSTDVLPMLRTYTGHFAPEFEYEEWALAFRAKLKSKFLETATKSIAGLVNSGDLDAARGIALATLEVDETATDMEHALVWLHWHLGAKSAAKAQYEHLQHADQLDGLEPVPLFELVERSSPISLE